MLTSIANGINKKELRSEKKKLFGKVMELKPILPFRREMNV